MKFSNDQIRKIIGVLGDLRTAHSSASYHWLPNPVGYIPFFYRKQTTKIQFHGRDYRFTFGGWAASDGFFNDERYYYHISSEGMHMTFTIKTGLDLPLISTKHVAFHNFAFTDEAKEARDHFLVMALL